MGKDRQKQGRVCGLQNHKTNPTVYVGESHDNWLEALRNWVKGKFPTDSRQWELGVVPVYKRQK